MTCRRLENTECPQIITYGYKHCKDCIYHQEPLKKKPWPKQIGQNLFDLVIVRHKVSRAQRINAYNTMRVQNKLH